MQSLQPLRNCLLLGMSMRGFSPLIYRNNVSTANQNGVKAKHWHAENEAKCQMTENETLKEIGSRLIQYELNQQYVQSAMLHTAGSCRSNSLNFSAFFSMLPLMLL